MTQYIYTGECSDCGTEHRRDWRSEWRGPDGETSYAADCRVCGPGHEIHMSPELPENETVEVWSIEYPSENGTTMIVSTTPDLPDDDDGDEEPGAMCKRALARASTSVDLIRQVAIRVSGADDAEDFERTYGHEDQASIQATAREIIALVRSTDGRTRS